MAGSKIPTAADLPQVAPKSLRGVRVGDISGGMNEAVQEAGQAGGAYFIDVRNRAEETEAQDLINQLRDKQRLLMDGDGSEKNPGYSNLTGKTAVDERNNYEVKYQTEYDDLLGKASSDRVRSQIIKQFGAQRNTFLTNVSRHQGGQRIKYEDQVHTTASDNLTELAISEATFDEATKAWGNKKTIAEQYAANLQHYRKRTGDAKVAKDMADEARSKTHVEVIDDLLTRAGGGVSAEKYFNAHVGEIDQKVKNELRTRIENGSRLDTAQTFADDAIAKFAEANPTKSERELMSDVKWQRDTHAEIGRKFSGETEKEVRAEFDRRITRFTKQENSLDAEATYKATEFLATNPDKSLLDFLTATGNKAQAKRIMSDPRLFGALVTLSKNIGRAQTTAEFANKNNAEVLRSIKPDVLTDQRLRQMTPAEMDALKKGLTEQTWKKLDTRRDQAILSFQAQENPENINPYAAMKTQMKSIATATKDFDFGTGAGGKKSKKIEAARNRARLLEQEMMAWMGTYRREIQRNPTLAEVKQEIVRRSARIVSDPPDTGPPLTALGLYRTEQAGEEEIKGFITDIRARMSPQQRANAIVPYERMRLVFRDVIRFNIRKHAPAARQEDMLRDESFFENLAGAIVMNDTPRMRRLLEMQ